MPGVELTQEQQAAVDKAVALIKTRPLVTLGGLAGTGKTTIMAEIARALRPGKLAFVAFTGKAKSVLEAKLKAAAAMQGLSLVRYIEWLAAHLPNPAD